MLKKYYISKARRYYRQITKRHKREIFPYSHLLFHGFYDRLRLRLLKESVLHRAGKILDVGCCDGYVLLTTFSSGDLKIGIDVMPEALRNAKTAAKTLKRHGETEFLLSDTEKLVLKDSSIDIIISAEVLEHVFDPSAALKEYSRVLKPGGLLILSLPIVPFTKTLTAKVFLQGVQFRSPFHLREYSLIKMQRVTSLQELFKELNSLNFKIIRKNNLGVFYLPISKLAKFKFLSKFLETLELKFSAKIPLLLGGVFILIEAKKVQSLRALHSRTRK